MVVERLPGIIIANSIDLSGIDIRTVDMYQYLYTLRFSSCFHSCFLWYQFYQEAILISHANPLEKYCCFYSSAAGFCDYEEESNDHGFYQWNETRVGEIDKQICTHGIKPQYSDGKATRLCGHTGWMNYDGSACISNASNELTLLREVNWLIYNIHLFSSCNSWHLVRRSSITLYVRHFST